MTEPAEAGYAEVADRQLDAIQDDDLYNDALEACESILDQPGLHRPTASAIQTEDGRVIMRSTISGRWPWVAWWSTAGPRIEAVMEYPR